MSSIKVMFMGASRDGLVGDTLWQGKTAYVMLALLGSFGPVINLNKISEPLLFFLASHGFYEEKKPSIMRD